MLFGRRQPADWREKMRIALWPRRSWGRSFQYVTKRVLRLTASPHAIAAGVAAGVFASFTPFMGFHFIIAFAVAYLIAGNFISAALGTFVGNPLTFPLIWASTYATGRFILSGTTGHGPPSQVETIDHSAIFEHGVAGALQRLADLWDPVLKPMTVGGVPLGVFAAIVFYLLTRQLTITFREARRKRMEERRLKAAPGADRQAQKESRYFREAGQ